MLSRLKKARANPKLPCFSYNQSNHIYIYVHKNYIYTYLEVANGSLEDEFCLQKGCLFPLLWLLGKKYILYEIILIIHLLTKDSDIHSHLGSSFQNSFPQDSVHGWATETRSNSEDQAPRSSRCHDAMPRCQCWLVTWRPLAPVGKSTVKTWLACQNPPAFFDG